MATNKKNTDKNKKQSSGSGASTQNGSSSTSSTEAKKSTSASQKKDSSKNINSTLQEIKTKFGEEAIMKLGDRAHVNVNAISSGSIGLDWALGIGGMPRGRVIEIFGPESSGKTTLALHTAAEAQKRGGICAYIDAEQALDPEYSKRIGINVDDLLISQPSTGEEALEIAESLVRSGKLDVIVIDSVAALTPKDEIEGEMGQYHVGKQARLMSQALRKLTAVTAKSKAAVIFINQIRMKIGVSFGCFSYDTKVLLADSSKREIGKIVNQQQPVEVLSYNFDKKQTEKAPVVDWHNNGETEEFLQFFVANHTGNGRRGFSCTPEHKIYTSKGWKKAKDLKVGDGIATQIKDRSLTPKQEEIIMGSLLGDGNVKKQSEQTAYFREEHSSEQADYVKWLAKELGDITSNVSVPTKLGNALLETTHLLRIGDIYDLFYPEKTKVIPESLVEDITPRMLALWYCGDGTLQKGTSGWKGKTYERRPRAGLYVNGFQDAESRDRINRIFEKFELGPTWRQCGKYQVLQFNVADSRKFFDIVSPFIPKAMEYKLPDKYKGNVLKAENTQSRSQESEVLRPMKIKEIRKRRAYQNGKSPSKKRFDITVAGNHNYFVDDCLVSNSPETTPGGKALKFYTSVRLDIRRIAKIKKGEEVMGGRTRVKVVKNKVAAPFRSTEFDLMYNEGISKEGELLALGEKHGLVKKSGANYSFGEHKLGRGYEAARKHLKDDPKAAKELLDEINKNLK